MANPILQKLSNFQQTNTPQFNGLSRLVQMLKGANNPQGMLDNMIKNNPKAQQILSEAQKYGNDPMSAFRALAQERGVDPDEFLHKLGF